MRGVIYQTLYEVGNFETQKETSEMNIQLLKQQLAEGKITKEQFLAELKKLLEGNSITQEEHDAAVKMDDSNQDDNKPLTLEQVQKLIQSETDKVRTDYSKKLKDLEKEKEDLLKEKMTEEQRAQFEIEKRDKEIAERERALNEREVALHVVDELTAKTLPLSFKEFLVADTKEDATKRIDAFAAAWNDALKAEVEKRFKDNGDDPTKGKGGGQATNNPWSKEQWNLTKQAQITKENPQLAKTLSAQAGQ